MWSPQGCIDAILGSANNPSLEVIIKTPIRIGLIGLGRFCSRYHIPNLLRRADTAITAVCDTDPAALAARDARLRSCREFSDYRRLIEADLADGVIISTPNIFHYDQAWCALKYGIHALVDKPLTMKAHQAAALVDLSKVRQRLLHTAFTRHFMTSTEYVRRQLAQNAAGPLQLVTAVQCRHLHRQPELNGGMFLCRTVHLTDVIPWLTDQPFATAWSRIHYDDAGYERFAEIRLEMKNGLPVQIHCLRESAEYQDEVTICGTRQSFRLQRDRLWTRPTNGGWSTTEDLHQYGNSTDHFIEAMQDVTHTPDPPYADSHGADGFRALCVLEAIIESHRRGSTVAVPYPI